MKQVICNKHFNCTSLACIHIVPHEPNRCTEKEKLCDIYKKVQCMEVTIDDKPVECIHCGHNETPALIIIDDNWICAGCMQERWDKVKELLDSKHDGECSDMYADGKCDCGLQEDIDEIFNVKGDNIC